MEISQINDTIHGLVEATKGTTLSTRKFAFFVDVEGGVRGGVIKKFR